MATIRDGKKSVLMIVDVQVDVVKGAWEPDRIVGNVALAVDRARAHGVPVIWVQHADDDLPQGSPEWQWVPELVPAAGEPLIHKNFNSSFENTTLDTVLAELGATHIVLAGCATNWCIRATAYGALERGYDLTLVKDAHPTKTLLMGNGTQLDAVTLVHDLNMTMAWLSYPGRKNATAKAAEISF